MALTITVGAVDITAYVPFLGDERFGLPGLQIDQDAATFAWRARIPIVDSASAVSVAEEDTVSIADGATTFFSGRVAYVNRGPVGTDTVTYVLDCQSKHILLEETVVESESYVQGTADSAIIDDLFTTYLASIDSTTYVSTLDASMEAIQFAGRTLRQCLTMIAARTGGRFYVDVDDYLHYFSSESNAAAFDLSDNPDFSTTYPCERLRERTDATVLIDRVLVIGSGVSGWVGSGDHEAIVWDETITTSQGVTDRGNAIIGRYDGGLKTYTCAIREGGLQAGMDIDVTNSLLGLSSETLTIRRLRMTCESADGEERLYRLELGDALITSASAGRNLSDLLADTTQAVNNVSDDVFDTDAPAAPTFTAGNATTGVRLDADGHQIVWIRCTWGLVSDADLDHYEIQIADNTAFNWPKVQHIQAGETREAEWVGLRGNISYYARVRAVDWVGNYSAWSPASPGYLTITSSADSTPPAQVAGETAAGARTLIGVTWTANSELDLAHYEIQSSPNGSTGWTNRDYPLRTYFIDQDFTEAEIQAGTTRYYRIRAVDTSGNDGTWSSNASASTSPIGSDTIAANAIIAVKIAANAVEADKINANAVTTVKLNAGAVTATKIDVSTLSAITADMGTLTAGEIRVGTGTPGVDFTGFRIFASYIAGYSSDVAQFYVDSSDGKAYWGGGVGRMDVTGIMITPSTAHALLRSYAFHDGSNLTASLGGKKGASENEVRLQVEALAGLDSYIGIYALAPSGQDATIELAPFESTDTVRLYLIADQASSIQYLKVTDAHLIWFNDCPVFINDSANANMTIGLTINQGANDDEALALKSSDVAHGYTGGTETDTYGTLAKTEGTSGGLIVSGFKDADGSNSHALALYGYLAENVDTTKTTAGRGIITLSGRQTSGASLANTVADGNVFAIATQRGGASVTVMIVDEDGDIYYDGTGYTYEQEDDVALLRELSDVLGRERGAISALDAPGAPRTAALGIIHPDENGVMMSSKRHAALLRGAILQLEERVRRLEAR